MSADMFVYKSVGVSVAVSVGASVDVAVLASADVSVGDRGFTVDVDGCLLLSVDRHGNGRGMPWRSVNTAVVLLRNAKEELLQGCSLKC